MSKQQQKIARKVKRKCENNIKLNEKRKRGRRTKKERKRRKRNRIKETQRKETKEKTTFLLIVLLLFSFLSHLRFFSSCQGFSFSFLIFFFRDISKNQLTDAGVTLLLKALTSNTSIVSIDFSGNIDGKNEASKITVVQQLIALQRSNGILEGFFLLFFCFFFSSLVFLSFFMERMKLQKLLLFSS